MYPTISEYLEAIKSAEDNFDQLKHLRPVLDDNGQPVMTSGNFAVVFKMKDEETGKLHAVKCFLREQEGRAKAYRQIAEELEYVSSTFLTPIKYLDKELFVDTSNSDESEFPVLLMDWVEGQTLDKYIRVHIDDQYDLSLLAYQFSRLAMWLMPQPFAHGDLKPDNILVRKDGTLALVDYDGMYVPAMKGQRARELGSPDFRHPSRTEEVFNEHIDDFSLVSILLSLKAIALQPDLLEKYGASDRLLFSTNDYRNLSESQVMDAIKTMMQDPELATLYSLFILSSAQNNLSQTSFRLLNLSRPKVPITENLSTEVTENDLINAWTDEFGAQYSYNRERLLHVPSNIKIYTIRDGTKVICNTAFVDYYMIPHHKYPDLYDEVYSGDLESVIIPESVEVIGNSAFRGCKNLGAITIPNNVRTIGDYAFKDCSFLNCLYIPESVKKIGNKAFDKCQSLCSVSISDGVEEFGSWVFAGCRSITTITLPNSVKSIGKDLFLYCNNLTTINIPHGEIRKFESLLPKCKDKLVEQDDDELCLACSTEQSRACEDKDYALWQPNVKIIKKNGKLGVVIDNGKSKKQIIPFTYDAWFDYDGNETEIREDFFDNYQDYIGYFAIKNADGTFTIHGFDKEGTLITSFTCEKFNPDSYQLNGKYILRYPADGEMYDDIRRMRMDCNWGSDTSYIAFRKGNKWSLKSDDLKKTYIDYYECDGFDQMYWTPKGYYVGIKIGGKIQISLWKKSTGILILPNLFDSISLRYFSTPNYDILGSCLVLKVGDNLAVCSNDLQNISPFIFSEVSSMLNDNEVKVTRIVNGKEFEFIYKIINTNGWRYKGSRSFNPDEIAAVCYADVVKTQYGLSARFNMMDKFGGYKFIPLSTLSTLSPGDTIDMNTAKLITLCKDGEDDITRVIEQ